MATSIMTTPLLIGGEERLARRLLPGLRPGAPGEMIGHAAAASRRRRARRGPRGAQAWPAWAALAAAERAATRARGARRRSRATPTSAPSCSSARTARSDSRRRSTCTSSSGGSTRRQQYAPSLDERRADRRSAVHDDDRPRPAGRRDDHLPVQLAARDPRPRACPYALMAGNTVVVKPPPTTPLSVVRTLRHIAARCPPGVLNVVTGADAVVGPVVVGDPRVKHVCFTGSVGGGKADHGDGRSQPDARDARARRQRPGHRARRRSASTRRRSGGWLRPRT